MDPFPKVALYPTLSFTGMHPKLAKAALPAAGLQHFEDWDDLASMPTPFMFERIVLGDRGAAARSHAAEGSADPEWAGPFLDLQASENWAAPLRAAVAGHVGVSLTPESGGWWKRGEEDPVVVYVSKQLDSQGPKLKPEDHQRLVAGLKRMGGYEVVVVDANTPWEKRMRAIVRATVSLLDLCLRVGLLNDDCTDCAGCDGRCPDGCILHANVAAFHPHRVLPIQRVHARPRDPNACIGHPVCCMARNPVSHCGCSVEITGAHK